MDAWLIPPLLSHRCAETGVDRKPTHKKRIEIDTKLTEIDPQRSAIDGGAWCPVRGRELLGAFEMKRSKLKANSGSQIGFIHLGSLVNELTFYGVQCTRRAVFTGGTVFISPFCEPVCVYVYWKVKGISVGDKL